MKKVAGQSNIETTNQLSTNTNHKNNRSALVSSLLANIFLIDGLIDLSINTLRGIVDDSRYCGRGIPAEVEEIINKAIMSQVKLNSFSKEMIYFRDQGII